jgi:hypothetical protein
LTPKPFIFCRVAAADVDQVAAAVLSTALLRVPEARESLKAAEAPDFRPEAVEEHGFPPVAAAQRDFRPEAVEERDFRPEAVEAPLRWREVVATPPSTPMAEGELKLCRPMVAEPNDPWRREGEEEASCSRGSTPLQVELFLPKRKAGAELRLHSAKELDRTSAAGLPDERR